MPIPRWDLDGLFPDSLTEFEQKVGESYRPVWKAIGREAPKGRVQEEVPIGFLNTHDRQIEFPPCSQEHSLAAQRFVAFARGQLRRRGYLGKSSDELRFLTVMRQFRVWNIVAPHFGTAPSDWSEPYIDVDRGLHWVDNARHRHLANQLFRWRVRHYEFLRTLSDFNVLNYIMGLWLLLPKDRFLVEVIKRGYIQKLQVADVGKMGSKYPAIGVARREPYWSDLEEGFRIAVVNRIIPVWWDGTKVETPQDVIAFKQRNGMELSDTEKQYLRTSRMSNDELRDALLRGLAQWKTESSSTPSNTP